MARARAFLTCALVIALSVAVPAKGGVSPTTPKASEDEKKKAEQPKVTGLTGKTFYGAKDGQDTGEWIHRVTDGAHHPSRPSKIQGCDTLELVLSGLENPLVAGGRKSSRDVAFVCRTAKSPRAMQALHRTYGVEDTSLKCLRDFGETVVAMPAGWRGKYGRFIRQQRKRNKRGDNKQFRIQEYYSPPVDLDENPKWDFELPLSIKFDFTGGRDSVQCEVWDLRNHASLGIMRLSVEVRGSVTCRELRNNDHWNGPPGSPITKTMRKLPNGDNWLQYLHTSHNPSLRWLLDKPHGCLQAMLTCKSHIPASPRIKEAALTFPEWFPNRREKTIGGKVKMCPLVFAHRAAVFGTQTENGLESMIGAALLGVDGVEIDVFLAPGANGRKQVVVAHDETLLRALDMDFVIHDEDDEYVVSQLEEVMGCQILTPLSAYLELAKEFKILMNIEMKPGAPGPNKDYRHQLGYHTAQVIHKAGMSRHVVTSSFDPMKLKGVLSFNEHEKNAHQVGALQPDVPAVGATYITGAARLFSLFQKKDKYDGRCFHYSLVNPKRMEQYQERRDWTCAYTLHDATEAANGKSHSPATLSNLIMNDVTWIETDDAINLAHQLRRTTLCERRDRPNVGKLWEKNMMERLDKQKKAFAVNGASLTEDEYVRMVERASEYNSPEKKVPMKHRYAKTTGRGAGYSTQREPMAAAGDGAGSPAFN